MLHTRINAATVAAQPTGARSYTVADNSALDWHVRTRAGMPFELRCYGRGTCTIGGGVPSFYGTREAADRAGRAWVVTGTAPADQRVAS